MLLLSMVSNETVDSVLGYFKSFERIQSKLGSELFDRVDFDIDIKEDGSSIEFIYGVSLYKDYKLVGFGPSRWTFSYSPWSLDNDHFGTLESQLLGLLDLAKFNLKSREERSPILV